MSLIANDYIPKINGDPPSIKYGYIYNWFVKEGEIYNPITSILLPFDTESASMAKDYSGNNYT